ncbi:MAG: single-stranded DNA-binding protein [Candidatus Xenobia bacterium]
MSVVVNEVKLGGRLAEDPEPAYTPSGEQCLTFSLIFREDQRIPVVVPSAAAAIPQVQQLRRGDLVTVWGELHAYQSTQRYGPNSWGPATKFSVILTRLSHYQQPKEVPFYDRERERTAD